MSQVPNPFTQAASQGYGDFAATLDDEDDNNAVDEEQQAEDEEEPEGPQSPEPEEQEINELGFTQTQEREYPTGIDSPDEDETEEAADQVETSENEQEHVEEVGPSSPVVEEADASNEQPEVEEEEEEEEEEVAQEEEVKKEEKDEDNDTNKAQSQQRRRVQIMDDSDNEDEQQPTESTSVVGKGKNNHSLKQFTMKNEDSHKKHKKRHSDEHHHHHHEKKSKRFRKASNDEEDKNKEEQQEKDTKNVEATSDVEDVVDDIFGKNVNDNEEAGDDQEEAAAELAELNDDEEEVQREEEDAEQRETFDADDDDEDVPVRKTNDFAKKTAIGYDIDLYLEKKAEKRRGNRRRAAGKNGDIDLAGPDGDEFARKLIDQMNIATEEDRIFNKSRQPATAKLLLLPIVEQHLYRADLTEIFLDNGILTVIKDWLSPLPDKSLPNIKIRQSFIKILQQFGVIHADPLRDSGIGKALMYLYKHPRETKENKIKLIKIIHDWARPIFNLDTDYKLLTREERQQRDADQASLKRQTSLTGKPKNRSADMDFPFANDKRQGDDDELNKDDDCPRARVPRPSNKDYVVRPVSTVEYSEKKGDGKKKTISRLDEIKRRQQDRKRLAKPMSIVKLSIEGNKMHL